MKIPVYRSADNGVEVFVGHAHTPQEFEYPLSFDDAVKFDPDKDQYTLEWSWASPGFGSVRIERVLLCSKVTQSVVDLCEDRVVAQVENGFVANPLGRKRRLGEAQIFWEREWYEMKVKLFDHMVERKRKDLEETEAMRNHYVAKLAELVLGGRV